MKNPEGKREVQIFNMKKMLLRIEEEEKPVGEMNFVEETKANPKAVLNLSQKQQYVVFFSIFQLDYNSLNVVFFSILHL